MLKRMVALVAAIVVLAVPVTAASAAAVKFSVKGKSAYVNNAKVITANILCSNGIVHAINQALIPPNL